MSDSFFCHTCLVDKPDEEQSPDPRYCQSCFTLLAAEAGTLPAKTRIPDWVPRGYTGEKVQEKVAVVPWQGTLNMSTSAEKKIEVDIIPPGVFTRTLSKRGPKEKPLPLGLIRQWVAEGMGSKRIASRLSAEHGITVSYKTIQRLLSGKRKQGGNHESP